MRFLKALLALFRLPIVQTYPGDMQADSQAMFGLMGFWRNANAQAPGEVNVTTAGTDSTLTAAQVALGIIILAAGASGGFTITLPSTASIIAALGASIPKNGTFSKLVMIKNNGVAQTGTLTAGDGSTTITGTATIATDTTRTFLLTVDSASAITFENLGSMAL